MKNTLPQVKCKKPVYTCITDFSVLSCMFDPLCVFCPSIITFTDYVLALAAHTGEDGLSVATSGGDVSARSVTKKKKKVSTCYLQFFRLWLLRPEHCSHNQAFFFVWQRVVCCN